MKTPAFHFPGQEHVKVPVTVVTPTPKPSDVAPSKHPVLQDADVRRRATAVEMAIKAAGTTAGNFPDRTYPDGLERLMHAAYTFERYLATGIPTVYQGLPEPDANGSHQVKKA